MDYKIVYSSRRSIAIQVNKACEVIVRAPRGISKDKIEAFVNRSQGWIEKHLQRQADFNASHKEPSEAELEKL